MSQQERDGLRICDGVICDNGDRGIVTELSNDHMLAFVQWEMAPGMRSAASMKHGVNPLGLPESRSLALQLAVAEAML